MALLNEVTVPYRFQPVYAMMHVGYSTMFKPTGGTLVFRLQPPTGNRSRRIFNEEYRDVLTLTEVNEVLSGNSTTAKMNEVIDMYRPQLLDNDSGEIAIEKVARYVKPFGVTSISECKNYHKDVMVNIQPVLIYGASKDDKRAYDKHDTLRLPVDQCDLLQKTRARGRSFVYVTFNKDIFGGDWKLKFVITPEHTYFNMDMLNWIKYSLVYRLGIVDHVNAVGGEADAYVYKPATDDTPACWYIEGFVYNINGAWELYTKEGFKDMYDNESRTLWDLLEYDSLKKHVMDNIIKSVSQGHKRKRTSSLSSSSSSSSSSGGSASYNKDIGPNKHLKPRRARFIGGDRLGRFKGGSHRDGRRDGDYSCIPSTRSFTPGDYNGMAAVTFTASPKTNTDAKIAKALRAAMRLVSGADYNRDIGSMNKELNTKRPTVHALWLSPGDSITMTCQDIFHVILMALTDRLISSAKTAGDQLSFNKLFTGATKQSNNAELYINKLACVVNYVLQCLNNPRILLQNRRVTFWHRKEIVKQVPLGVPMNDLTISATGKIEDIERASHVDFANQRYGGGILGRGAVQEEIMLLENTELLMGRGLFSQMTDNSACLVFGAIRFNSHTGYGSRNFKYKQYYIPRIKTPKTDQLGRALTEVVAIDATNFKATSNVTQYTSKLIEREFFKAYTGFKAIDDSSIPVVSGRWGSGDFAGDPTLKGLIQYAAGSLAGRPLMLRMMGDDEKLAIDRILKAVQRNRTDLLTFFNAIISAARYMDKPNPRKLALYMVQALDGGGGGSGTTDGSGGGGSTADFADKVMKSGSMEDTPLLSPSYSTDSAHVPPLELLIGGATLSLAPRSDGEERSDEEESTETSHL